MNEEEFIKAIKEIPKSETSSCISSYNSINVDDLVKAVDRFNKIPNYNDLLKENQQLKEQLEYLRSGEYYNQLRFERNMLQYVVDNSEVSEEDKKFVDMTHRNTELVEENQQLKEQIKLLSAKKPIKDLKERNDQLSKQYQILEKYILKEKM